MIINHPIYGRFNITEPVLIELIKSPALQRLKKIGQLGAWHLHADCPGNFNRFQHSLGVMLLLRKFGASLPEQIAGLLHDISHTAFSHVIDRVFGRELTHDYQDSKLAQAFELQGISKILKKHGIKPATILDFSKFTLLESDLPNLCADRLDYTLQDPLAKILTKNRTKEFLKKLIVYRNQFVFADKASVKKFGELYLKLNQKVWCNPLQSTLYYLLAEAIKLALARKIVTKRELFTTDRFIFNKLTKSKNKEILEKIRLIKKLKIKLVKKNQADFCSRSKFRIVDPYFLKNGRLVRLSAADRDYKNKIAKFKKSAKKGYYVKVFNLSPTSYKLQATS